MVYRAEARQISRIVNRGLASRLEEFGNATALVTEQGERMSYAELASRADEFAARLGRTRRLLLIEAVNEIEPLVAYLGALRGGHPVLLAAEGTQAKDAHIATIYRPDARFARVGDSWVLEINAKPDRNFHPDLAVLLSTSGSTGSAKLVRLSHRAIDANAGSIARYLDLSSDDRAITSLPFHYSYGLSIINSHLSVGATLLLTDRSVIDPEFWTFFAAERGTSLAGVPYTYDLLDRSGFMDRELPSLRTLTQAGGRMAPTNVLRYLHWAESRNVRLFIMYGQTEATARMAYVPPALLAENSDCVGVAIPGGLFRLLDERGGEIDEPDVDGELVYLGPNVMMGYAEQESDLARGPELDALHTGDIAQWTQQGLIRIVGRKSRFCKFFGLRISLDEVEAAMREFGAPGVAAGDDQIIAVVARAPAISAELPESLAARFRLNADIFEAWTLDEMPTLASGKVDYRSLLRTARERREASMRQLNRDSRITAAFGQAFPGQEILQEDTFASLGGDSLTYVTTSIQIEDAIGELPTNWENLSVGELTRRAAARLDNVRPISLRTIETEVVVRALAIVAVVVQHASTLPVGGAANILLMLAGFNLARYQRSRLAAGRGFAVLGSFVRRIVVPYYLLLLLYAFVKGNVSLSSYFLVSNYEGRYGSILEPFWFLETLLQCLTLVALLFAIPSVQKAAAHNAWHLGLAALALAVLVKLAGAALFDHPTLLNRTPDALFYLLAFGWCLHLAQDRSQKIALSLVALGMTLLDLGLMRGFWYSFAAPSNYSHAAWILLGSLAILWVPQMLLTRALHRVAATLAAASFYIYLTHGATLYILIRVPYFQNVVLWVGLALLLGVCSWWFAEYASRWLAATTSPIFSGTAEKRSA